LKQRQGSFWRQIYLWLTCFFLSRPVSAKLLEQKSGAGCFEMFQSLREFCISLYTPKIDLAKLNHNFKLMPPATITGVTKNLDGFWNDRYNIDDF